MCFPINITQTIIYVMAVIDSVSFGEAKVNGKIYYSDVVVWWDGKVDMVTKTHQFGMTELLSVLRKKPVAVILGTGLEECVEVLEEVSEEMENRGLMLFVEKTPNAIEIFNGMVSQGKRAVAFLHVTF
jgi:hypothetical protein